MIAAPNIIRALMVATVFSGAFLIPIGTTTTNPAPILAMVAIALFSISHKLTINRYILFVFAFVALHGLLALVLGLTSINLFGKTYIAAFLLFWGFSIALRLSADYMMLLRAYLVGAVIIATIGTVQALAWLAGLRPLYDYSWIPAWQFAPGGLLGMRLNSILFEPSQVAFTIGPAACIALFRISGGLRDLLKLRSAVLILVLALFSGSSAIIAMIGLFMCIMLVSSRKNFLRLSGLVALGIFVLAETPFFGDTVQKFYGLNEVFLGVGSGENVNATTFTLFFHSQSAIENFLRSNYLGGGIGSHEVLVKPILAQVSLEHNVYNANSAGNLTFRLISEFGLFGVALMIGFAIFVVRGALRLTGDELVLHAAFSSGVLGFFIRNGTYAHYGLALYIVMLLAINGKRASIRADVSCR